MKTLLLHALNVVLDGLDRSINYPRTMTAVGVLVVALWLYWLLRRRSRKPSLLHSTSPGIHLVRESARTISTALAQIGKRDYVGGFEHAVRAWMLAEIARSIDDNTSVLTQTLGVDFDEFQSYVGVVVNETRSRLERRVS